MLGRKVRPNWIPSVIYKEIENQRMKENLVITYYITIFFAFNNTGKIQINQNLFLFNSISPTLL